MSEESKTDYVSMGEGSRKAPASTTSLGPVAIPEGLDDPSLSQEDRDLRLAIALQQQENAAAYDAHKKRHDDAVRADKARTTRSNTFTQLATPAGMAEANAYLADQSGAYETPADSLAGVPRGEIEDRKLAAQLQKVEQSGAGTAATVNKMLQEEKALAEAQKHRTEREGFGRGFA
jgi:hypothetical protein